MASDISDETINWAYARLESTRLPNGQFVRPFRGFLSAAYVSWANHFKRMAEDRMIHSNGNVSDPMVSEPDSMELSMDNCQIVNRFDIAPDHVRVLFHRQENYSL